MDCSVVVEAAIPVYNVDTTDEAVRIAIAKTGDMINPDLSYVEINAATQTSPAGEDIPPAFIVANEALVALDLELDVFNVDSEQHAERIALGELGQHLETIALKVVTVTVIADE